MSRRELPFSVAANASLGAPGDVLGVSASGRVARSIGPGLLIALALSLVVVLVGCSPATNSVATKPQSSATPQASAGSPPSPPKAAPAPGTGTEPKPPVVQEAPPPLKLAPVKNVVSAPAVTADRGPRIAFNATEADFGDIQFGDVVQYAFEFKNIGKENLVVSNVQIETIEGC